MPEPQGNQAIANPARVGGVNPSPTVGQPPFRARKVHGKTEIELSSVTRELLLVPLRKRGKNSSHDGLLGCYLRVGLSGNVGKLPRKGSIIR